MGISRFRPAMGIFACWLVVLVGGIAPADAQSLRFAPVSGELTSYFGWRQDPIHGSKRFHGGIDIAANQGKPIFAPQVGRVIYNGKHGGYGNVVVLDHGGGLYTLYGHTSKILVTLGQFVQPGQVIAQVGSTGRSTGPHLHFEVHYNKRYVDPIAYLGQIQKAYPTLQNAMRSPAAANTNQQTTAANPGVTRVSSPPKKAQGGRYTVQLLSGNSVQNIQF